MRAKFGVLEQTHGLHLHTKLHLDRFNQEPVAMKNPKFCQFFGLWHFVVLPFNGKLKKLKTGAQIRTFSYPMVSNFFLFFIVCTNAVIHKREVTNVTDTRYA